MNTKRIDEYGEKSRLNHKSYCIFLEARMIFKKRRKSEKELKKYYSAYRQGYTRAAASADGYFVSAMNALSEGSPEKAMDVLKQGSIELSKSPSVCVIRLD